MPIKIAGAQIGSRWEDPQQSLQKAEQSIRRAVDEGASLICFPEQYPTGWDPRSVRHVEERDGPIVSRFRHLAQEYGIAILGSFRERSDPKPRNTCIVLDPHGEIAATYAKSHLFTPAHEDEYYSPGTNPGIFRLSNVPFGIAICYDLRFPGLFGTYARAGVCCMLVPAAWPASRIGHWELLLRARALEYQMYVMGVNPTGMTPVETYCGRSLAIDPSGTVVAEAGGEEALIPAIIDPEVVHRVREALPVYQNGLLDDFSRNPA
ncbi:MAG TPA: nitrilase-related carbon-nitrogen hydrolase [Methanoregulaceae archaeon]|nr:nitrilase-related carbon-nitrogen hydrolase [Methanoregulaceae archaeon]